MKLKILCLFAALLSSGLATAASYSVVADTPYSAGSPNFFYYSGFNPSTIPTLTANLSSDKQLELTFVAPAGMRYQIAAPLAGSTGYGFFADLWTNIAISAPVGPVAAPSISFSGTTGAAPTLVSSGSGLTYGSADQSQFRASGVWTLSEAFSFESLTMTFNVPAGFTYDFLGVTPSTVRLWAYAANLRTPPSSPFMTLVPFATVPEPGTLALLGLGLAGLALSKRRKAA